jgi:hypothetical protein
VRGADGRNALVGGTACDFTEAKELALLFANDVVFNLGKIEKPLACLKKPDMNKSPQSGRF